MPLLDTTQYKDTLGTFVSELVLQVLAFVAEKERDNIKQRQAEGISIAKAQGRHLGRPKTDTPTAFDGVYKQVLDGTITAVQAMRDLGLKKTTYYKLVKDYKEQR